MKKLNKYKYIYLFIVILGTIGLLSGYFYYNAQNDQIKETIHNTINIEEELSSTTNNIFKSLKDSSIYLVSSITIIPEAINIFNIYYEPFEVGFIFNTLKPYSLKFTSLYTLIYYLVPLLFKLILLRLTMTITYTIIKYIFKKQKSEQKKLKLLLKKYLLITFILIFYEFILFIFNANIHRYLMTFLHK